MGRYVKKHIPGGGVIDVFKMIGRKEFGKTTKEAAKTATKKALQTAGTKTSESAREKAGDKKHKNTSTGISNRKCTNKRINDYEINERVNQLLSGSRKRKFI